LWQQGMIKEYQDKLSFITRQYIENQFDIPALEQTTDEIIHSMVKTGLEEKYTAVIRDLLPLSDLVKFAKADPPPERHKQLLEEAEWFVFNTKNWNIIEPNIQPVLESDFEEE